MEHMFFVCPWTRTVWFGSSLQLVVPSQGLGSFDVWMLQKISILCSVSLDFDKDFSTLACILWSIWRGRNNLVFKATRPDPIFAIQQGSRTLSALDLAKPVKENAVSGKIGRAHV